MEKQRQSLVYPLADPTTADWYIPNFVMRACALVPLLQIWQIWLMFFNNSKTFCLPLWKTKKPLYTRFSNKTARKIANWTYPGMAILATVLALVLGIKNNIYSFWWWLALVLCAPVVVINTYAFVRWVIGYGQVIAHEQSVEDKNSVEVRDGAPGAGKTSSENNDDKILAEKRYNDLCTQIKLLKPFEGQSITHWPKEIREDAEEMLESYYYYKNTKSVPMLWSSVPTFVDGVPANRLTADHLLQRKRLPYGAVGIIDESALVLPQQLYHDSPYELIEMCKFPRHFLDIHIGSTEQDEDSNVIYLRRVAGKTMHMIEQRWILKPRLGLWLWNFCIKHTRHMTKAKANFFRIWEKILKNMGFRKYYYWEEIQGFGASKRKSFILRPSLNIDYDNRAYKNAYRCKDEPLEASVWQHKRLSKSEIDEIFTQELKERAKAQAKRKAEAAAKKNKQKE